MCSNGRGDRGETGARSFSREAGSVARMGPTTAVAGDRGWRGLEGAGGGPTRVQRPDGAGERPPPTDPLVNASDRAARWYGGHKQPAAGSATPSPELGEREHQPHQVRLPRDGLLLVDLL